jgi:uncharacterized phiE125 gp8 family phage protein
MNITVIVEPPFEPVTLSEVYASLRLDPEGSPMTHPHDDMLNRYISTARQEVEAMARRCLIEQTLRLSMSGWPINYDTWVQSWSRNNLVRSIRLYRPPVRSVSSVKYYDEDNVLQTLSASDYYITDDPVPELRFKTTFVTPTLYDRPDAVRIEYVCGYDPSSESPTTQAEYAANVPSRLKDAIIIGVQLLYDDLAPADREAYTRTQEALVRPLKLLLDT